MRLRKLGAAAGFRRDRGSSGGALGGKERVRSTRNITFVGYGQYAYMLGGGGITGSPDAPEKYIAANDLRRVYDLEHARFQQLERYKMLFPFLIASMHNFVLNNKILDGDVAYDVGAGSFGNPNNERALRVARWIESPLFPDGIHMRRMWMLNNPIALVRAAMDPRAKLSEPRREGDSIVVDMTLKEGDKLTAGFFRRPIFLHGCAGPIRRPISASLRSRPISRVMQASTDCFYRWVMTHGSIDAT